MSFPAYPAYRDSGVEWLGEVPANWILTPLKYLALLNPRKSGYNGDTEQLCSFVPMDKLKTGVVQLDEKRSIEEVMGSYTYFEDGDVLQAKVTPCFENKNIAIAKGLTNGIGFGSSEINVLRPYHGVNTAYLYYRVQEDSYMDFCTSSMIGAGGLNRVPTDVINNFKVATPEIFEQTQIARFLDHETARIDALIEEQQRLIELLKEKRQAVISHAVTQGLDPTVPMKDSGVEWLGEVPAHWSVVPFGLAFGYQEGPGIMAADFRDEGVPLVRISGVQGRWVTLQGCNYLDPAKVNGKWGHFRLEHGDLIISGSASMGLVSEVGEEAIGAVAYTGLIRLTPKIGISDRDFIRSVVGSYQFFAQIDLLKAGSTIQHFGPTHLSQMKVVLPPLDEQIKVAAYVDRTSIQFAQLIDDAGKNNDILQERRAALISAAVTGKIDVRGWQPPTSAPSPESAQEAI